MDAPYLYKFFKSMLLLAFLWTLTPGCHLSAQSGSNTLKADTRIFIRANSGILSAHKEIFQDVLHQLNSIPGIHAETTMQSQIPESGYLITVTEQINLPKDGQSFSIALTPHACRIGGQAPYGYQNGLYYFLDLLGFRWYMPGKAWAIVPDRLNWPDTLHSVITPDFRDRSYFGTGGWGGKKAYDPDDQVKQAFILWNQRNRISATYPNRGHAGIAFYQKHKAFLDRHPEYFCNGQPGPNAKIRLKDPAIVDYIVQQKIANIGTSTHQTIGMDPHDGSGGKDDCLDSPKGSFRNYSDKYFYLANAVAKAIPDNDGTIVDIYAYSSHAAIPSFSLDENVRPFIIPYAFQRISPPEKFVRDWSAFQDGKPLGLYDYWNITQWSKDLPQFNLYTIPRKLDFWKAQGIQSISIESTWAKGPMGHAWWLFSRYAWNTQQDFDRLYDQFLTDCFGEGAADVKRMYDRWSTNFQYQLEAGLSLADLDRARTKTTDPAIHRRLDELAAYVVYMDKYYDYTSRKTATAYDSLTQYIREIHPMGLLQSEALIRYYLPKPASGNAKSGWESQSNVAELVRLGRQQIKRFDYNISHYKTDLRKLHPCASGNAYTPLYINGSNTYQFYIPHEQEITINLGTMTHPLDALILDSNHRVIAQKEVATGAKKELTTSFTILLKKGVYSLRFGAYYQFSTVKFPEGIVFTGGTNHYDNYQYPVQYIYVPPDVDAIIYQDAHGPGTNRKGYWRDPSGNRHDPEQIAPQTYRIAVPSEQKGKVWQLVIGHTAWRLLNIPNVYSVNCFRVEE